jgi:stage II sporulation protein D
MRARVQWMMIGLLAPTLALALSISDFGLGVRPTWIRLRLSKDKAVLRLSGRQMVVTDAAGTELLKTGEQSESVVIRAVKSRDKGHQAYLQVLSKDTQVVATKIKVEAAELSTSDGVEVQSLSLAPTVEHKIEAIAVLEVEQYVTGVLAAEMPATWPLDALKAQAVAARSYALRLAAERQKLSYDVDASIYDQAFAVADNPTFKQQLQRAVRETRGQVLFAPQGQILKAFYSADCGCQSEDPKYVWGAVDSLISVTDPSCSHAEVTRWSMQISKETLGQLLLHGGPSEEKFEALQIHSRTPSGRVADLSLRISRPAAALGAEAPAAKPVGVVPEIVTKEGRLSAQEFRRRLGFEKIRSTDFNLKLKGDTFLIRGRGAGHAVGLCQRGARALAQTGHTYAQILKHFYPNAKMR